jgi:hypothetical protein
LKCQENPYCQNFLTTVRLVETHHFKKAISVEFFNPTCPQWTRRIITHHFGPIQNNTFQKNLGFFFFLFKPPNREVRDSVVPSKPTNTPTETHQHDITHRSTLSSMSVLRLGCRVHTPSSFLFFEILVLARGIFLIFCVGFVGSKE